MMNNRRMAVVLFLAVNCGMAQSALKKPDVESRVNILIGSSSDKIQLGIFNLTR